VQQILYKLTIPIILSVAILIAGVFAFMPVEKASTVHPTILAAVGEFKIHSLEKTLPKNTGDPLGGDDKTWTLTAVTDVIVRGVYHDSTPNLIAELCTFADHKVHGSDTSTQVHCTQTGYRIVDMEVAGSELQTGQQHRLKAGGKTVTFPVQIQTDNHVQLSEFPQFSNYALKAGDTIVMVFDTLKKDNDVRIDVIFAVTGEATLE